jgi:hypothetical protein
MDLKAFELTKNRWKGDRAGYHEWKVRTMAYLKINVINRVVKLTRTSYTRGAAGEYDELNSELHKAQVLRLRGERTRQSRLP